jgi:hypothetical protein
MQLEQPSALSLSEKFKPDHLLRPIIIVEIRVKDDATAPTRRGEKTSTGPRETKEYQIILERFHSCAKEAEEFLI